MRVYTTPWVRDAMTDEERTRLDGEPFERDDARLWLIARSPGGPFTARLWDPALGSLRTDGATLRSAIEQMIGLVRAG
jgi:hypothetical protein